MASILSLEEKILEQLNQLSLNSKKEESEVHNKEFSTVRIEDSVKTHDGEDINKEICTLMSEDGEKDEEVSTLQSVGGEKVEEISTLKSEDGKKDEEVSTLKSGGGEKVEEVSTLKSGGGEKGEEVSTLKSGGGEKGEEVSTLKSEDGEKHEEVSTLKSEYGKENEEVSTLKHADINKDKENTTVQTEGDIKDKQIKVNKDKEKRVEVKTEVKDEEISAEKLDTMLECPFSWKPVHVAPLDTPELLIQKILGKVEEQEESTDLPWRHYMYALVLSYEYFRNEDYDKAMEKARLSYQLSNETMDSRLFSAFPRASEHVSLGCQVYILVELKKYSEAASLLKKVKLYDDMTKTEKAAVWGIRSAVHMEYGFKGTKEAVGFSKAAISLDSKQAEWQFLLGKCLGRIRRIENYNEVPSSDELRALEKAVELSDSPSYIIFLAQSYREAAFRAYSLNRDNLGSLRVVLREMNSNSLKLYKEAAERNGACSHVNIRCAQGFMKLPYPFKDIERAKQCIKKALVLAPNNAMANHVAGLYFEQHENDTARAMEYYKKSGAGGSFGAFLDFFRLKLKNDAGYNPIPDLEKLLVDFQEEPRQLEARSQMVSYYLLIKNDIMNAAKIWREILKDGKDISKTEVHKCVFLNMKAPVSLFEVMYDELRLAVKDASLSDEDKKMFRSIILNCIELNPDLGMSSPKPQRKLILEEVRRIDERDRERSSNRNENSFSGFRRPPRGRGRGRYGTGGYQPRRRN